MKPTSEKFYYLLKLIADYILDLTEELIKQYLGTVIGNRFLKWFTDAIVKRFYSEIAEPISRVSVIKAGYYYDMDDAENKIKKLKNAEDANDEELYLRTLNDIRRKL